MELVISRKRWARGEREYPLASELYSEEDQKMCCLGFFCRQVGMSIREINSYGTIDGALHNMKSSRQDKFLANPAVAPMVKRETNKWGENDLYTSRAQQKLIDINDSRIMREETRERKLTEGFAKIGVKVKFVD